MTPRERRARQFALSAHGAIGQKRRYTGEDYIVHPERVVTLVRGVHHTDAMLCAAWLHDTVEDTAATIEDILLNFGEDVSQLVEMLTDPSRPEDGNRAARTEIDRLHLSRASPRAKTIKLADIIDNASTIRQHDPVWATIYLEEKRRALEVLREGDPLLWQHARKLVFPQR